MKKTFLIKALSLSVLFALPGLTKAQCLKSWKYHVPITITNNTKGDLKSYQVKLGVSTDGLISDGKMNSKGDDIRFIDKDSCTFLPYWIESGINSSSTVIWVKVPVLEGSKDHDITMYYGNNSASAMSNGDSTFIIFDDFDGSALNTTKWSAKGASGSLTVNGGELNFTTPATGRYLSETIVSNNSFASPLIVESKLDSLSGYWHNLAIFNKGTMSGYGGCYGETISQIILGTTKTYYGSFATNKDFNFTPNGSIRGIWKLSWPENGSQDFSWPEGDLSGNSTDISLDSEVQIAAGMLTESNGTSSIDWIRARGYASQEPTVIFGTEVGPTTAIKPVANTLSAEIYPNPASDKINIKLRHTSNTLYQIEIADINGKLVISKSANIMNGNYEMNIGGLTAGVYFIKISGADGTVNQKLTITK